MSYKPKVLAVTEGGTGVTASDPIIQQVRASSGSVVTCSTALPVITTKPQNTAGTEVITLAITPKSASNILVIDFITSGSTSAGDIVTTALFQDSTADALCAFMVCNTDRQVTPILKYYMTAGTTSSTTFKIRIGTNGANTFYTNAGTTGVQLWGGLAVTNLIITEYAT